MFDQLTAAVAAYDRELAALERLGEQIQAAASYGAAAGLIVEFENAQARVRAAARQVERQKALHNARLLIPPIRDETDDETKGAHMSRNPRPVWCVRQATLVAEIPDRIISEFQVADRYVGEERAPWREYLVPATVLNSYSWEIRR